MKYRSRLLAVGDVSRISPQAPVPVAEIERQDARLGDATNVARKTLVLGADATSLFLVGDHNAGYCPEPLSTKARMFVGNGK